MTKHPPLRPSSADRWLRCPGTIDFLQLRDGEVVAIDAKFGSELHIIFEADPRILVWRAEED